MKLFEISAQVEHILATAVDMDTGEVLNEEALAHLNELEIEKDALVLEIACYLKGEEAEAEAVKAQARLLSERAQRHLKRADWLRSVIARNLEPGRKLSDSRSVLSWRKSKAVLVTDEAKLPDEAFRYKREVDKTAIGKMLEAGPMDGAEIEHRQSLVVK